LSPLRRRRSWLRAVAARRAAMASPRLSSPPGGRQEDVLGQETPGEVEMARRLHALADELQGQVRLVKRHGAGADRALALKEARATAAQLRDLMAEARAARGP
ncbi:unnamed protein product, partial [Prorocentrum cordatum]